MAYSLSMVTASLLAGEEVSWEPIPGKKAETCQLKTPGARRLMAYLLTLPGDTVAAPTEDMFAPLKKAWDAENDPAKDMTVTVSGPPTGPWKLTRIETENFGGLNLFGGEPFVLDLTDTHLSLEGYNGAGKTSLISAILWALTGFKALKQDAPQFEKGDREQVYDRSGKRIGSWPPMVVYPDTPVDLKQLAYTRVRLEFESPDGKTTVAERKLTAPETGEPSIEKNIDPALLSAAQLIEANLLMPARIPHVAFGDKKRSESLYSAIKFITGLDQLADVAAGVSILRRSSSKFLKYAKDKGADRLEWVYTQELDRAREAAQAASFALPEELTLGRDELQEALQLHIDKASTLAADALSNLSAQIDPELDLQEKEDRDKLGRAVHAVKSAVGQNASKIGLFSVWTALSEAEKSDTFSNLPLRLRAIQEKLDNALMWHERQQKDEKLRLKALASRYFIEPADLEDHANCPLCDTMLVSEDQQMLKRELSELKSQAVAAERTLKDACSDLGEEVNQAVPATLLTHLDTIACRTPRDAFEIAMRETFVDDSDFSKVLVGLTEKVGERLKELVAGLPNVEAFASFEADPGEPTFFSALRKTMAQVEYTHSVCVWWASNREVYRASWSKLIGQKDKNGIFPEDSLNGMLASFENAQETAGPLDEIATYLAKASKASMAWKEINDVQLKRQAIADSLEPLRNLSRLVEHVTRTTLDELSSRMTEIVKTISVTDRFEFDQAKLVGSSVTIEGSFAEELVIDATLVANTSWLRGILWAFVFALRERCVRDLGVNVIPLMVFDDPQMTFDQSIEQRWANDIARRCHASANDEQYVQLILVTHSRSFFNIVTQSAQVPGECGKLFGPRGERTSASIINGTALDRKRDQAQATKDPDDCAQYVGTVRVYTEELLRIMLRGQASEIAGNDTLIKLVERLQLLRTDNVQPFAQRPFKRLVDALHPDTQVIKLMNKPHHEDDGRIGFAEFEDVLKHWNEKLGRALDHAFALASEHAGYSGDPRYFPWPDNIAELPISQKANLSEVRMNNTGVAAAASTDGRIGDGLIVISENPSGEQEPIRFYNHSAYRLLAPTLSPVAEPGDTLLVKNYGTPRPRNLVVAAHSEKLLARRLNDVEGQSDVSVLTGQARDPYILPEAAIALKDRLEPKKIIGTLFTAGTATIITPSEHEIAAIEDFSSIKYQVENTRLLKVTGHSMQPIALDGQFVLVKNETIDEGALTALEGKLVIAVSSDNAKYFKRLRLKDQFVILESVNSDASSGTELLSLAPQNGFEHLTEIYSVRGVLFEDPS